MSDALRILAELRRAFDLSFAQAPALQSGDRIDLVLVRAGELACAVRLDDLAEVRSEARISKCPAGVPGFLGLTAVRGALMPVWDIAHLVGGTSTGTGAWLLIPKGVSLAFLFDQFDRHVRVEQSEIRAREDGAGNHVRDMVEVAGCLRPIMDIPSVVAEVTLAARTWPVERKLPNVAKMDP